VILVALQLVGNLLSIPMMRFENSLIEPPYFWVFATFVSGIAIAFALYLGGRTGLGAPLLEGFLRGEQLSTWYRRVIALSMILTVIAIPYIILVNIDLEPGSYPAIWKPILASVDAGVQEEIFSRLLLMTLFVWLGSLVWREPDGRPTRVVFWIAIIISGVLFGWSHIDDKLSNPEIPVSMLLVIMIATSFFGIILGWMYWTQGIECAMLAHFFLDAVGTGIVVPAYLSSEPLVLVLVLSVLIIAGLLSWRYLVRMGSQAGISIS
jgi:hypothetical protein